MDEAQQVGPTEAEMKAALKDPSVPDEVKKVIKQHFYGPPAPRHGRILQVHSPEVQQMANGRFAHKPLIALNKARRPAGMTGRQWKRMRKEHDRPIKAILKGKNPFAEQTNEG